MTVTRRYAESTTVSVEKSRAEIEVLLKKHGATAFFSAFDDTKGLAMMGFRLAGRMFRIEVRVPKAENIPKAYADRHRYGMSWPGKQRAWIDQEERRRWRVQLLMIKAKLEMIATGDTTAEREFLADMLMPDGATVGQRAIPALAEAYRTGAMPSLPMLGSGGDDHGQE